MQLRPRLVRPSSTSSKRASRSSRSNTSSRRSAVAVDTAASAVLNTIAEALDAIADPVRALGARRFFKEAYCPHDVFVGIRVPDCREIVQARLRTTKEAEIVTLLLDKRHEHRLAGALCVVEAFKAPRNSSWNGHADDGDADDEIIQQRLVTFYLKHLAAMDNWDLIDASCHILGEWMGKKHVQEIENFGVAMKKQQDSSSLTSVTKKKVEKEETDPNIEAETQALASAIECLPPWYQSLVRSTAFWETRVSIVMLRPLRKTHLEFVMDICRWQILRLKDPKYAQFIKNKPFTDYDLVHKACGWVLRDCGRVDRQKLLQFLHRYAGVSPKTTVRYATEHLDRSTAKTFVSRAY